MITNQSIFETWLNLTDRQRAQVITKFNLELDDPQDFLDKNDIKNFIHANYIKKNRQVVVK
jgi:hypothetical protein